MTAPNLQPAPAPTLSKAVVRAANLLGLPQAFLADVLGISRATASRLVAGRYQLDPRRPKEWELGLLFVRLFRSLDALLGHEDQAQAWLRGPNAAFGRPPVEEIRTAEGLVRVIQYLDAVRGRV
ncbi:MAG: antitoxin Xre/MbcA/ParS toxin-binding domain-containing protein [Gemmatimonadales bacterium]